jgi:hypothetical protein
MNELAIFGDEAMICCKDDKLCLKAKGDEGSISIERRLLRLYSLA